MKRPLAPKQKGRQKPYLKMMSINSLAGCLLPSRHAYLFLLNSLLLLSSLCGFTNGEPEHLEVMEGDDVSIPCDVTVPEDTSNFHVLWYKAGLGTSFYSFTGGQDPDQRGKHFHDGRVLGDHDVFFNELADPPALEMKNALLEVEGLYYCEAHIGFSVFREHTNVTVIIPPNKPEIIDSKGKSLDLTSMIYDEGSTVDIACQVVRGKPRPTVNWYWGVELQDSKHDSEAVSAGVIRNRLLFGPLERKHAAGKLICMADSPKIDEPLITDFKLIIRFKPLTVRIVSPMITMVNGDTYHIQCESTGAYPAAEITWWLDGEQITENVYNTFPTDYNETNSRSLSSLEITPLIQHRGKELQCHAQSPVIDHLPLIDSRNLTIYYMDTVTLTLEGAQEGIIEGGSAKLRCTVESDPAPNYINWYIKSGEVGEKVEGEYGSDYIIENLTRNHSGQYSCVASNDVGDGYSNMVMLEVNYKPTCRTSGLQMIGTGVDEMVKMGCLVDSSPSTVSYKWMRNTTGEMEEIPTSWITAQDQLSILEYTPDSEEDYGQFFCYAENSIGSQEAPCQFELVSAMFPTPLVNCSSPNNDTHTVYIQCISENSNSLPITYVAEVYDVTKDRLLRNITSQEPAFKLEELDPGSGFKIDAYATNVRGPSETTTFHVFTLPLIKKSMGILIGIVGAVVLMALVVVIIIKLKANKPKSKLKPPPSSEVPARVTANDQELNHKYGVSDPNVGKHTIINFPPPPTTSPPDEKDLEKVPLRSRDSWSPNSPDVEYAELEFQNQKKNKKKKKKSKSKKKEPKDDEETAYASIDQIKTMKEEKQKEADAAKNDQLVETEAVKQPLLNVETPKLPEGALESSV